MRPSSFGTTTELKWIAVSNLSTLWVKAQRPLRESWVTEIASERGWITRIAEMMEAAE